MARGTRIKCDCYPYDALHVKPLQQELYKAQLYIVHGRQTCGAVALSEASLLRLIRTLQRIVAKKKRAK